MANLTARQLRSNALVAIPRGKLIRVLMAGPALDVKGGISTLERLIIDHAGKRFDLSLVPTTRDGGTALKIAVFLWATLRIAALAPRCDVAHVHFASKGSCCRKAILICLFSCIGLPVVVHAHGAEFDIFYNRLWKPARRVISAVFHRARICIVLGQRWQDFYGKCFRLPPTRIRILQNTAPLPKETPDRTSRGGVAVLFLGRIGERKGAFDLITCFSKIKNADARLILAGDGEVGKARTLASDLSIGDRVTIHSWLNADQVRSHLTSADLFVLPSYHEGLPMALLEAMAAGLPVITTPVGSIPELVRHGQNGILVEPGNHAALADALRELTDDAPLRLRLGAQARIDVGEFGMEPYMSQLQRIYTEAAFNG